MTCVFMHTRFLTQKPHVYSNQMIEEVNQSETACYQHLRAFSAFNTFINMASAQYMCCDISPQQTCHVMDFY